MNGMQAGMAGAAAVNPYAALIMGAMQTTSQLLGSPSGPQMSSSQPFAPFTVDNSGWAVNFGSNGSANAQPNPVSTLAQGLAGAVSGTSGSAGVNLNSPLMLLVIAAVVIVAVKRK